MRLRRSAYLKTIFILAAVLAFMGASFGRHQQAVLAHPLGNFTINHYSRIELAADQVSLRYVLDLAEIPTFQEKASIDQDRDGQISRGEEAEYLASKAMALQENLELLVNENPVQLRVVSQELDFPPGQGGLPTLRIGLLLQGALTKVSEQAEHTLYYQNDNYRQRLGWKEIVVKPSGGVSIVNSTAPQVDQSNELRAYPEDMLSSPPNLTEVHSTFTLKGGISESARPQSSPATVKAGAKPDDAFTSLVTAEKLTLPVAALSLIFALGLGAAHALSPGHGKTIMAAYLVGTRGSAKHALFLGLTVTLSHTLGVLALGAAALYASSIIAPERLYPWLGFTSGVIILGIGAWLLISRARNGFEEHRHPHSHPHGQHHHRASDSAKLGITWKNLTALGVVGGLVPSASALVILLAAISLHRLGFGLLLILAFSAGMAAVLAGVGLVLVYAGRAVEQIGSQSKWVTGLTSRIPLFTALIVLVSGLVLAVRAALQIGLV